MAAGTRTCNRSSEVDGTFRKPILPVVGGCEVMRACELEESVARSVAQTSCSVGCPVDHAPVFPPVHGKNRFCASFCSPTHSPHQKGGAPHLRTFSAPQKEHTQSCRSSHGQPRKNRSRAIGGHVSHVSNEMYERNFSET